MSGTENLACYFPLPTQCSWQRLVQNATQLSPHFLSREIKSCRFYQKKKKKGQGKGEGRKADRNGEQPGVTFEASLWGKPRHRHRSMQGAKSLLKQRLLELESPEEINQVKSRSFARVRCCRLDPTPSPSRGAGGAAHSPICSALAACLSLAITR